MSDLLGTKRIVANFAGESADCATSRRTQEMVAYATLAPPLQCHIDTRLGDVPVQIMSLLKNRTHASAQLVCAATHDKWGRQKIFCEDVNRFGFLHFCISEIFQRMGNCHNPISNCRRRWQPAPSAVQSQVGDRHRQAGAARIPIDTSADRRFAAIEPR